MYSSDFILNEKKIFTFFFRIIFFFSHYSIFKFRINKIYFFYTFRAQHYILATFISVLIQIWNRCICDLVAVMLAVKLRRENRSFSAATKWSRLLVTSIVERKKATNRETLRGSPLWRSRRSSWVAASSWRPLTPPPRT